MVVEALSYGTGNKERSKKEGCIWLKVLGSSSFGCLEALHHHLYCSSFNSVDQEVYWKHTIKILSLIFRISKKNYL